MKLNKKKVFVVALAISIVAILSMSSLAWFTASQSVENIFQVSTTDDDQTPDFSITLYENIVDPDTGKQIDSNNDGVIDELDITTTGNTYTSIAPGDRLDKNPTVVNTGAYDQYIRITVTLNDADKWIPLLNTVGLDVEDVIEGYNPNGVAVWRSEIVDGDYTDGTVVNEYYLNTKLLPNQSATLFTGIHIPDDFTIENVKEFAGEFNMTIVADAIQADNTGDNAYDAFDLYWN